MNQPAHPPLLPREEYVEQAHLFEALQRRDTTSEPVQDMLRQIREEVLSTTQLPMAIGFLLAELRHVGTMGTAMQRLHHYFTPFQTFLVDRAEDDQGRFDMQMAFRILQAEAKFKSEGAGKAALFFYQTEALCRNRLDYDHGFAAMAMDPVYDSHWQRFIMEIRHKIGMVELADLIYVHSEYYRERNPTQEVDQPLLFGQGEGRIALANRKKEPQVMFASLQRHLSYPAVPRPQSRDTVENLMPKLLRTVERLESRIKLLEQEQRQAGIDLNQFSKHAFKPDND